MRAPRGPHRLQRLPLQHHLSADGEAALSQGDLDGLCGLYAGLNGIRLLLGPHRRLTRREIKRLFQTGVSYLCEHRGLADAVVGGFDDTLWRQLLQVLTMQVSELTGHAVAIEQPFMTGRHPSREQVFDVIDAALADDTPVLIELSGVYHHFTVISGYSPTTLFLFDSGTLQYLRRRSCTTQHARGTARHHINVRSVMILTLAR